MCLIGKTQLLCMQCRGIGPHLVASGKSHGFSRVEAGNVLCFGVVFFFGRGACGVLSPQPGIKPAPLALEGEVLITGLPENSLHFNIVVVV